MTGNDYIDPHQEYSEARRMSRERYFFARNSKLSRMAKQQHGFTCQACKFNFYAAYGELGKDYIEAHHLNPLSERPEAEWSDELLTSVDGITVLCANCHRMIHRKRPAISLDQLVTALALATQPA